MKNKKGKYVSGSFTQYKRELLSKTLNADINCIEIDNENNLLIGTNDGLYVYSESDCDYKKIFSEEISGAVKYICFINGVTAVCSDNCLFYLKDGEAELVREFDSDLVEISLNGTDLWVLSENRLVCTDFRCKNDKVNRPLEGGKGLSLAVSCDHVYAATQTNISTIHGKRREWKNVSPAFCDMPEKINTIRFDSLGYLWLGSDEGIAVYDNFSHWFGSDTVRTFPKNAVYKIECDNKGGKYFASDVGVILHKNGRQQYFSAERWIPSNKIIDIAVAKDGSFFYVATDKGISKIDSFETTLEEKAKIYDDIIEKYHIRRGFTATRRIEDFDIDSGTVEISDNDGSWTGCYVAAQAFRYAATKENEALEKARRGMNAMLLLGSITGIPGFTARAVRYPGEDGFDDGNHEWVKTEDGQCEWKCETSSDEMTCQFFALSVYYDLCADDNEKEAIRKMLCAITDHIVRNNYRLVDHDGLPTTWAVWNPQMLNYDDKWFTERGVNSLELLSFLKISYHISDDEKYKKLYEEFIKQHHYPLNAMQHKIQDAHICHIDDNLAFLATLSLLRLEDNPDLRAIITCGLEDHWQYEKVEKQPLFCFIYSLLSGNDESLMEGVNALRTLPLDLITYNFDLSARKDIVIDTEQELIHEEPQLKYPVPNCERNVRRPDSSVFKIKENIVSRMEEGTFYLLPYWIARYYGLIEESGND